METAAPAVPLWLPMAMLTCSTFLSIYALAGAKRHLRSLAQVLVLVLMLGIVTVVTKLELSGNINLLFLLWIAGHFWFFGKFDH